MMTKYKKLMRFLLSELKNKNVDYELISQVILRYACADKLVKDFYGYFILTNKGKKLLKGK